MEEKSMLEKQMNIQLQLAAAPALQFNRPDGPIKTGSTDAFSLLATATLPYPVLNKALFAYLGGKRFDLSEGLISTHIIIEKGLVESDGAGNLLVQVHFGGSFYGSIYIKGRPQYDATLQAIRLSNLTYDLQSTSLLLRLGKTLLSNKIGEELASRSLFPLQPYYEQAEKAINEYLQKQWTLSVKTLGKVQDITVQSVVAAKENLEVQLECTGNVAVEIQL